MMHVIDEAWSLHSWTSYFMAVTTYLFIYLHRVNTTAASPSCGFTHHWGVAAREPRAAALAIVPEV